MALHVDPAPDLPGGVRAVRIWDSNAPAQCVYTPRTTFTKFIGHVLEGDYESLEAEDEEMMTAAAAACDAVGGQYGILPDPPQEPPNGSAEDRQPVGSARTVHHSKQEVEHMTVATRELQCGRDLVPVELFDSIVAFTVGHFGQTPERAGRIADQALAFVATAATATVPMVPSDDVDHGLHAFILHTKEYTAFCQKHAGRMLHHNPRPGGGPRTLEAVRTSAHAMKARGFAVYDDLWTVCGENAAQCDSDCGRPYALTGGEGEDDGGEPNPPTGDGDDGRQYGE